MFNYAFVYLAGVVAALIITPPMIYLARRGKLVDRPGLRKVHKTPIPRIGGVAVILSITAVLVPVLCLNDRIGLTFQPVRLQMIVLLATSAAMGFVGLLDDIFNLRARYKLAAQVFLAAVVCAFGIRIEHVAVNGLFMWKLGVLSWPISVLWIVSVTNAMNMIDGLDGLAGGIAAITCATIAVFCFYAHETVMAVVMLAVLGSLSGFLFFNLNPAKVFLGDAGSNFLGFMLAVASIFCAIKSYTLVGFILPAMAMGLPILDTFQAVIRRTTERRPISPDRSHLHHRLLDRGFDHRSAVRIMHGGTLITAAISLGLIVTRDVTAVIVLLCALLPLVLVFRAFGGIRIMGCCRPCARAGE